MSHNHKCENLSIDRTGKGKDSKEICSSNEEEVIHNTKSKKITPNLKKPLSTWIKVILAIILISIFVGVIAYFIIKSIRDGNIDPPINPGDSSQINPGSPQTNPGEPPQTNPDGPQTNPGGPQINPGGPQTNPADPNEGKEYIIPTVDEIKEIYKPIYKINSNINSLTQTTMKSKRKVIAKSNNILDYTFTMAKIDIYVISEFTPEFNGGTNFYEKIITTSVVINSLCATIEGIDCEYSSYLDLTINNENGDDRTNIDDDINIDELTLPICLIEHTETNLILSVSCPRNLANNLKKIIIDAFESMKPKTIKGVEVNKTLADTTIEERDNKIYINSFSKICENGGVDKICEINSDIITHKDGNFISCNRLIKTEIDSTSNEYDIEITSENEGILDPNVYKKNLDTILGFIESYMNKESYSQANTIEEIMDKFNQLRHLVEENSGSSLVVGKQENDFFFTDYKNIIKLSLSLADNIFKGNGDESEISSDINYNNNTKKSLSNDKVISNLTTTINEFKTVSKAANLKGTELFNNLITPLTELAEEINTEFTAIDSNLPFKDLSALFDSTFTINKLNEFPYIIITAVQNTFSNIKNLDDDLLYTINDYKSMLKNGITSFLTNSHNLMITIFNKIKELTNALSSRKSKFANIANFYGLNTTNTSFGAILEKGNEILGNYYIKEKNLIMPLINDLFDSFLNYSNEKIKNGHYIFDNITNRLEDENVIISGGDENDIKIVIDNLFNTKLLENQIPKKIVEYMKKSILQSNGYFVTQRVIEDNNNSFVQIRDNAINIGKTIDNCEYIDETFDEIMKYFRDQLIVILKNMEKSKLEKFPIKTKVLNASDSISNAMNELDDFLRTEKVNINNLIKRDNKNFLELIQQTINSFIETNKTKLENIIKNIDNNLSKLNLNNIDDKFYEMLNYSMNNITNIIDYNNELCEQYMNDVKDTKNYTDAIRNKLEVFKQKMIEIKSYLSLNLKTDLVNKYRNIMIQIKNNLKAIQSNSFINKYNSQKDLSFMKTHINTFIDPLFSQLDDYISEKIFNTKYLPKINTFINNCLNKLEKQIKNLKDFHNRIRLRSFIFGKIENENNENDIYYLECKNYYCILELFGICFWKIDKYRGKKVVSSSNYNKIKSISFLNYSKDFDEYYNQIYFNFSNNVVSYNNIISNLDNQLEIIINDYSNKTIENLDSLLDSLSERSKSFVNEQLGIKVLQSSYNFYKNDLNEKLPIELNSILEQWKSVYNKVYQDINTNINKFKYPIKIFGDLANIYYCIYYSNISYFYSDTVIEQRKNDFNYTIKYYYNLFLSKINKTYTYILNNIPKNEKPFDCLLDNKINEIKNSYNEILNIFSISKNEILNITKQINTLKVSETNFFGANSFAIDIQDDIEEELYPLISNFDSISKMAKNKFVSEESLAIWFYLENLINGIQINDLYEIIDKGIFIELQNNVYQNLLEDFVEIDETNLKNKILDFFTKSNEELTNNFENKKEKYKNMLQSEIFKQFYEGKIGLEQKIDSLYLEGLNDLDLDSKNKILKYLDDIIETIKYHMIIENTRLKDELTLYRNNYTVFIQRLNEIANEIYNKFHSAILTVINDFYSDIKQKFYTDYIEKYLDEFYNKTIKEKFNEYTFLNISFNLTEVMVDNIETLNNEYKNWALKHLFFLNSKKIQDLNDLFSIGTLKDELKNKIKNLYNTLLLNTLNEITNYTSENEALTDYDFSENIMNNISEVINKKINEILKIIEKMKGNKYNIEEYQGSPDFSNVKREIFNNIKNDFNNFCQTFGYKEKQDFYKEISTYINSHFIQITDNFVPSFGKDFFDRILKFNEIQKIQSLYQNLKYSLAVSLFYYIFLVESNKIELLPDDLQIKILSLNNIDSVINKKNKQVLSFLNSKFDEFLSYSKDQLVEKYINYLKNHITLKTSFNNNIIDLIKNLLDENKYVYEEYYINKMNSFIKNPFIEQYSNTMKEATKDMIYFVEENREVLRSYFEDILTMNKDETLNNIETKLNDTLKAIENYESHFESFELPQEFKNFLYNFVDNNILSHHKEIKRILDDKTKNLIFEYLIINAEDFKKLYNFENIESQFNDTNDLFKNQYFDQIIQSLKKYGTNESIYLKNLETEIFNLANSSMRILEEKNENLIELKLDKIFQQLKETSQSNIQYVQNLDIYSQIKNKIDNYINNIKEQYELTKSEIMNRKYTEEVNEYLYQILEELKDLIISYYNKVKLKFNKTKEYIENSISIIDAQIEESHNITYKTINDKYLEIKNNFNTIKEINDDKKGDIEEDTYQIENSGYQVTIKFNNFIYKNEFYFEIEGDKLKGKSINRNYPRGFVVDFAKKSGDCILEGKEMNINLNDISSIIDINYDISSTETKIIKRFNSEEYIIDNKFYKEIEQKKKPISIGGISVSKNGCSEPEIVDLPPNEKDREVIEAKNQTIIESLL